jgi:4-amino-4-deoxy-L-arabinose transferase-like glycosyltransferase
MQARTLPARGAALLILLHLALLVFRIGELPLLGPDEPRYTRVAVEMHRSGDFVSPRLQGEPWLEKPVLYYWLASASFAVLGETETAARLPSIAASALMVGVTALVGARLLGAGAGLHAGFVLGTCALAFVYGRAAAMDMLLAACVTGAIGFASLRAAGAAGPLAMPAAAAFAGLATLAKGPLGALLPVLVIGAYILATRRWSFLREIVALRTVAAFVVVAAPWYLLVWRAQGWRFVEVFLLDHNVQRFTSTVHNHPGPFYYYLPVLLVGLFPWSGLLLTGLASLRPVSIDTDRLLLAWLGLPLLFFSAAGSKLPGYILPCLPPLALLVGRAADRLVCGDPRDPLRFFNRGVALIGLVLGALLFTAPLVLRAQGEPLWLRFVPTAAWALVLTFLISRRLDANPAGTLALWRVGGAGFLLLLATAAPPLLAARESGRGLFAPAGGRDVVAWGAWRTAWMAGYFYNDGRVRQVGSLPEVVAALERGVPLVLCGPGERRTLEAAPGLRVQVLAEGPQENVLLRVWKE